MKLQKPAPSVYLIMLMLLSVMGCAAQSSVVKSEQIAPGTDQQAPLQGALQDIALAEEGGLCRLKITTTMPPTYTIFKLTAPERIIIDLAQTVRGNYREPAALHNDYVTGVSITPVEHDNASTLRIDVSLTSDCDYTALNQDNSILISLARKTPVAAPQPVQTEAAVQQEQATPPEQKKTGPPAVQNITVTPTPAGYTIAIVADTDIENYHSFALQNPNRLAIDLPTATSAMRQSTIPVGNTLIDQVRVAQSANKLRVVVDLKGETFPRYQVSRDKARLYLIFEGDRKPAHAATEAVQPPAPVTAPETDTLKPAVVAAPEPKAPAPAAPEGEAAVPEAQPEKMYVGDKISLDFKDADIKNVLRLISDISGLNMIVSENVSSKVTLKLDSIPWDEALDIILDTNKLGRIDTRNVTRIETIEQIKKINEDKLLAKKSQENIADLIVQTFDVSYAKAQDLSSFIKKMNLLSPRGSVTEFKLTNKLTVQDIPENVVKVQKLLEEQDIPTRQVMIESRIVQSNPSYVKELGIRWGGTYRTTKNGDPITLSGGAGDDFVVNLPAAVGEGSGGAINFGYIKDNLTLNMQLSALENDNKIKIVSNPRILGLDNKEARIKQGVALPYLKLSEEGVTSTEFKDAVLELKVTPKITATNTITLHIFVTKNQKSSQTGAGGEPGIDVREVETDLLVRSGETVVIGGIYETQTVHNITKVPVFGNAPYVGRFFRNVRDEDVLTELLVFLTITVVDIEQNLAKSQKDISG